jgi:hypothetical protein
VRDSLSAQGIAICHYRGILCCVPEASQ